MTVMNWVEFFLAVSALLIGASVFARQVIGSDTGTPETLKIAEAIKAGAKAFLKLPYKSAAALLGLLLPTFAAAQDHAGGGEANLVLPDLSSVSFFGMNGHTLLSIGLLFCAGGLLFGLAIYVQLKNAPVHRTMLEVSELIYET